ncbi:MAG: SDR family oxidoreductase [Bacteroidetes bacterium]|nr:SDR family oxidoreductase [Bacteroidota bacterium]
MNIIITGASRGIGYETAQLLSKEHKVIGIARTIAGRNLKSPPTFISLPFDLEKGNIKKDLLPQIKKHFDSADVLINNAAAFFRKPFEKISRQDFEKIFQVNVFSVAELTQAILPLMKKGHVLNIASMGGIQGSIKFPGLSAYSSSKGALITLTECLAEEYKNKNISFNAIAFGAVQTEMLSEAFPNFKAPLTATQAAEFVSYFAVNGNKYFNGKILQMALSTP